MSEKDILSTPIDWSLEWEDFQKQIVFMIKNYREADKAVPLPLPMRMEIACAVLSAIDCNDCDARCCKVGNDAILLPEEYENLKRKYEDRGFTSDGKLRFPCRFLLNNRCSIHKHDKPIICDSFPIQSGGNINGFDAISVSSKCPSAMKYARKLYSQIWQSRRAQDKFKHSKRVVNDIKM